MAQTVVAMYLEPIVEPRFHSDSYGYRPKRSALDAVGVCRERCWRYDWAIDLDVEKFFDTVPWDLVVRAVEAVCTTRWVLLYVKRWLAAPLQRVDGTLVERNKGTPQGSAVSPVLANLFMHFAFDLWMARNFPDCPFERYADDGIVHCRSKQQAYDVLAAISARMEEVGLRLHPDKTLIVYCKDGKRRGNHEHTKFTFLGYTFRNRKAKSKDGRYFSSFLPAMSDDAMRTKSAELRAMRIHRRTTWSLDDLARWLSPIVRGWMTFYGRVLPVGDGAPPPACQHLPETLGWEEVPEADGSQAVHAVVGGTDRSTASPVRPVAVGPWVRPVRSERSPVTGDCHAGI